MIYVKHCKLTRPRPALVLTAVFGQGYGVYIVCSNNEPYHHREITFGQSPRSFHPDPKAIGHWHGAQCRDPRINVSPMTTTLNGHEWKESLAQAYTGVKPDLQITSTKFRKCMGYEYLIIWQGAQRLNKYCYIPCHKLSILS